MKKLENNLETRNEAIGKYQILAPSLNIMTLYALEINLDGTEKQVQYAISLMSQKLSLAIEKVGMLIRNEKMTKEQGNAGLEKLIAEMESMTDAGQVIKMVK